MDPEVRRQQILEAAIGLIGQLGYQGFTVQKLAQACGLTNGGMLHYFGSKELLLVAILEERDRREAAIVPTELALGQAAAGGEYTRAMALELFHAIVARSVAQPELIRLMIVLQAEALNPQHPAHDYFRRRETMVLGEFAYILAGLADDPLRTARAILALIGGLEQQWFRADQGFDLLATCDALIADLLHQAIPGDGHVL
jgi:AcrR family transcriptional regulator